jgi:3-oxoacyl-[acyl-carrier protein] reductase
MGRRLNCFSQGGLPFDIASAVAFLASPGGSGMSGQTLRVCGGHITGR